MTEEEQQMKLLGEMQERLRSFESSQMVVIAMPASAHVKSVRELTSETLRYARRVAEIINRGPGGREVALAITKLQEAEHWLNDAFKELIVLKDQ